MTQSMPLATLSALSVHPAADKFPYMSDEKLLDLAQDIEVNGLIHPIVLYQNEILDGRNRLAALAKTNITNVPVEEYTGDRPVRYILSLNIQRRQLEPVQAAMLAVDLLPDLEAENLDIVEATQAQNRERDEKGRLLPAIVNSQEPESGQSGSGQSGSAWSKTSVAQAAEAVGVGGQMVARAKALALNAPDLADAARAGGRSMNDLYGELQRRQDKPVKPDDPYTRFENKVDRAISSLSDAIEDHVDAGLWRVDDTRYVESNLLNLLRIVRGESK